MSNFWMTTHMQHTYHNSTTEQNETSSPAVDKDPANQNVVRYTTPKGEEELETHGGSVLRM